MRFFSIDNPIFQAISRVGDFFILSFLFIITSIPVITIGASLVALFDVCIRILRKRDKNILKDYLRAFKNNFKQATIIWIPMAVIGAVLYFNINYWADEAQVQVGHTPLIIGGITIGLAVVYFAILHYVFAVQAVFENTVKATMRTAFFMSIKHFPNTIILLASTAAIVYACMIFPIVMFFLPVVGIGLFGMIYSVRLLTIFRKYNSELEPEQDESNKEPILQVINNKKKGKPGSNPKYGKSKVIK